MMSKSAVLFKIKKPLKILDLKINNLKKNQVLVKHIYSGFCSSQYGEISGVKGKDFFLPHCLGHESCGTIFKLPENLKNKFKLNDLVVCHWMKNPGKDCSEISYTDEKTNQKINSGKITTFSQFSVLSSNRITVVKKKYNKKYLPLMGCSIPVAISTLENIAKIRKNKNILILGSGALGLPMLHWSKIHMLDKIHVFDKKIKALKLASFFGANKTFNKLNKILQNNLNNNIYDYIVDTSGSSKLINKILNFNIRCKFIFLGVPSSNEKIKLNSLKINYGLRLLGSYGGNYCPNKKLEKYLKILLETKFPFKKYITKVYKFHEINKLIKDFKRNKILGKAIIKMN